MSAFGTLLGTLSGNGNSVTNPSDLSGSVVVAVGDLVVVVFGQQTNLTATAVTDNLGNAYTAQNAGTDAGTSTGRAFYSIVTVAGTLTVCHVAASASTNDYAGIVGVFAGGYSAIDVNPANGTDITSPFNCPASGTLAQASELIIAWGTCPTGTTAAWAATSPNLLAGQTNNSTNIKATLGYQVVNSTSTVTPVFTSGTNPADDTLGTFSFKQDLTRGVALEKFAWIGSETAQPKAKTVDDVNVSLLFRWSFWDTGLWNGAYWSDIRVFPTIFTTLPAQPPGYNPQFFSTNLLEGLLAPPPLITPRIYDLSQRVTRVAPIFDAQNLLASTLVPPPPAVTYIFRPPLYARMSGVFKAPEFDAPNLLQSTLANAAQTIFTAHDLPLPQRPGHRALGSDPQNLLASTLAPVVAANAPFIAFDGSLPRSPQQPTKPFDAPNLLQSTLSGAQAIFSAKEWPLPARVALTAQGSDPINLLQSTLSGAQAIFTGHELPLPQRIIPRALGSDPQNLLQSTLISAQAGPFHVNDFQLPAAPRPIAPTFDAPNLLLSTLRIVANAPVFTGVISQPAQQPISALTFDQRDSTLFQIVNNNPLPRNYDWPLPQGPRIGAPVFDAQNLLSSTLKPVVFGTPVFNLLPIDQPALPPKLALDFQMQAFFPPPPPLPPAVIPTGGHWLPPTREELERMRRELAAAQKAQEELWAERLKDQRQMHEQIMAQLHPERILGEVGKVVDKPISVENIDDDEDDIEFLVLYGI